MFETTQAASTGTDYQTLALSIVSFWDLYRAMFMSAFMVLLVATLFFVFRKHAWGRWLLLMTVLTGGIIIMLDEFKLYVGHQKKVAIRNALLAPVTKPLQGVNTLIKGIFGFKQ